MRLQTIAILGLTGAGFTLRLHYLATSHPFFDEYTTVLATRQILRHGWPILPSGLFYEHGLLATYLITPFTALFINAPLSQWQPAHWGLMLSRWPSVLLGTATVPLIFAIGRRCSVIQIANAPALLAAGLFALSPEGMVWGGRARMYALATLLVLLIVYWAYRGAIYPAPAKYRWWALLALLAALLTQLGALMVVPPLIVAMMVVGWRSQREVLSRGRDEVRTYYIGQTRREEDLSSPTSPASRVWLLRPTVWLEGTALTLAIGLAVFVKRLGQPLGTAALNDPTNGGLLEELLHTVTYQTAFHFTWADTVKFLSRQFGVPHHFWLTILTIVGAIIGLMVWFANTRIENSPRSQRFAQHAARSTSFGQLSPNFNLFLWLVFSLVIVQMVTLLEPFRRNPRYIVMYLPLFYLVAGNAIFNLRHVFRVVPGLNSSYSRLPSPTYLAIALLILLTIIGFNDLRIALLTPEPAYEEALAQVRAEWRPGDTLLTMNTPAAGLFFGHADGFTVQEDASQFLLNADTAPVDRWLGAPWVGSAADFNAAVNTGERSWFVIDTIRQPVYFRGDWLAVVNSQMEQVWANDNALVFRTRTDRVPMPTSPDTLVKATLGETIQLTGYTLQLPSSSFQNDRSEKAVSNGTLDAQLTLFWQSLAPVSTNYTVFLHLRNRDNVTVAQRDGLPLNGTYPTSRWQAGETVVDPITLPIPRDLPAGHYSLLVGMYRPDTQERLPVANDVSGENAILLAEVALP